MFTASRCCVKEHFWMLVVINLIFIMTTTASPVPTMAEKSLENGSQMSGHSLVSDVHDEDNAEGFDYPSDTHSGAMNAFSQLVADDSRSASRVTIREDMSSDESEGRQSNLASNKKGHDSELNLEGLDEFDETQYVVDEIYGYTYEEAVDISDEDNRYKITDNEDDSIDIFGDDSDDR